jgi:hypothetical protein
MEKTAINFKSVLINRKVREVVKMINNEGIPFNFSFNETSFELNSDGSPVLSFSPISGIIGPNSEIPIDIIFSPCAEKHFNFNLVCNIKKKPSLLNINVKGEGYNIHDSLEMGLSDGSTAQLVAGLDNDNPIDFGVIQINEKRIKKIAVINAGKYNFDFNWKFSGKPNAAFSIKPELGTVLRGERTYCELIFNPTAVTSLKNFKASCHIVNGQSYAFTINGIGNKPLLKFSQVDIDFGTQFVLKSSLEPYSSTISITNCDVREMSVDLLPLKTDGLQAMIGKNHIMPNETISIEITFLPLEAKRYQDYLKVEVNGILSADIRITGEATEFKVEPVVIDYRSLNFGAVRVGNSVTKTGKIINKSAIPATFKIGPSATIDMLNAIGMQITPVGEITLKPKSVLNLEMKFQPQARIPAFVEEIHLENSTLGMQRHLFTITGACQGIDIKLESDTLPFGAVVQKSSTSRRIQLQNVGDVGAKFSWDSAKFWPDFSISPSEGYISPGMDISLEVTFHPNDINADVRYENLICSVEGMHDINLTLTGMCVPQPMQTDVVKYTIPVRSSETKSITISNKTNFYWHTRPIIDNPFWTGPEYFDVEPGQTKLYDLTFTPLETFGSGDAGRHEGSVFFPIPDGSGILYKLIGLADKPLSVANISREIPCKTNYTEVLTIQNWLKKPQRFKVLFDFLKPDWVMIKGPEFIDVPPLLSKDYKLSFYSYKEGVVSPKVVFKNEQNQEYAFWNLTFKSTPPGVLQTIELNTSVRAAVTKEITIFNPLQLAVNFTASSTNSDVTVAHSFTASPR